MAKMDTVGSHKTTIYTENGFTKVKYHSTDVVSFSTDKIILNSGGWMSNTTKLRMNQASRQFGLGFTVTQKNYAWFVEYQGERLEFTDRMELNR